jgi:nucleoside-diphosphate-sugar epimerase
MKMKKPDQKISILGCGWYGLALAKKLVSLGYDVNGSTTSAEKLDSLKESGVSPFLVNFEAEQESFHPDFFRCDILLISIPPKRNTAEQHSFITKIKRIADVACKFKVPQIIFISSTSVYGEQDQEVTEDTTPVPDTDSGKVIFASEQLLNEAANFSSTVIRFGGLIGPARDPARFFAGKKAIANGRAPVNLIHLSDCIGITLSIIERKAYGHIYNACSPEHPSRAEFYTKAAVASKLEEPQFNDKLEHWKLVSSITIPAQLGYRFQYSINNLVLQ